SDLGRIVTKGRNESQSFRSDLYPRSNHARASQHLPISFPAHVEQPVPRQGADNRAAPTGVEPVDRARAAIFKLVDSFRLFGSLGRDVDRDAIARRVLIEQLRRLMLSRRKEAAADEFETLGGQIR